MSRQRRRVMYTQTTRGGGSELSLFELVRGLDKQAYEPIVLFYRQSPYRHLFQATGAKIITLGETAAENLIPKTGALKVKHLSGIGRLQARLGQFLGEVPLAISVSRIMRAEKIDIVHHNCGLNMDRAMVMAGFLAKSPQVSHFRLFSRLTLIARRLVKHVDAFIYITNAISECYSPQGIPAGRGHVIYNPIASRSSVETDDLGKLRNELGLDAGMLVVTNVGRIVPWKGQDYFLRAMAEVVKEVPNIKVLIVGEPGPAHEEQDFSKKLYKLSEDLGLSDKLIFTGQRPDIPQIMAVSDLVVHSAAEPEPFGRVIVEAMMEGCPVIATAAGGVPEIIEDHVTGLLVPPADAHAMAEAVKGLLVQREKAVLIGQRAQKVARERFSVQRHVQAVENVYAEVLNKKHGG